MASLVPPSPNTGSAPATPQGSNRLALTSLLLSLAPFAAYVLASLVGTVLEQFVFPIALTTNEDMVGTVLVWVTVVLYIASLIAFIGAIITGGLALRRAKQYPPQRAWTGLAVAGLVIGGVCATLLINVGAWFALFVCFVEGICPRVPFLLSGA